MSTQKPWITIAILTTTVASVQEAQQLARSMVQARLAACAQVEPVTSHYHWQDAVQEAPEWRIAFKTLPDALVPLEQRLRAEHPYQVPQMLVRTECCLEDYAQWVRASVDL